MVGCLRVPSTLCQHITSRTVVAAQLVEISFARIRIHNECSTQLQGRVRGGSRKWSAAMPHLSFSFFELVRLIDGRQRKDVPCPACGPSRRSPKNCVRPVLRLWRLRALSISYCCVRCGVSGIASQEQWRTSTNADVVRPKPRANAQRSTTLQTVRALTIWRTSVAADGSPVETYLASRGIWLRAPEAIRFHPGLDHPSGNNYGAMVALVTDAVSGEPAAIHRTFLAPGGNGKATVDSVRMMLGPCRGGVVRLAEATDALMIGEGIETCLAVMQATGRPAWAALSTSGLRTVDLPASIRDVTILADGDAAGEAAALDASKRWALQQSRRVRIARPPRGLDFNDMLPKPGAP
jgi:hypothetical protein